MTDQNPYLRLVESQAASDEAMLRESIYTAKDANPDLTARALPIAGKLNLPASEVERDIDGYEKQAAFESNDYLRIVNDYPSLSRFLRDTENAKLAHDDIGALTSIFDVVGRAPAGGVVEAAGGSVRGAGALLEAGSVATDRYVNPYVAPGLYLLSKLGGASAPDLQEAGAAVQEFGRETVMPPQSRQNIGTDIGSGVGQVAAYIASSLVSPFAPLALGATQGAGIQAERADKAGAEPGEKAAAVAVGAVVTAATERIQLGVLMKGIPGMNKLLAKLPPAIQNKWLNRLIDVGAAGASEATQETVEGFLQDTVEHFAYNPDVEFFNEWEREAIAAGGAGSIARAVVATVTGRRGGTRGGQETQQTAEAVNEAVAASKLRQRAPEKFREAIAGAMAGENVYINAEGAQTFYQSLDPEAQARLNAAMPDLKEKVDAAAETGADVVIDRADYMAYVAGSEEAKSLAEFVKFSASDLSAFDEKQILEQMNAIQDDGDVAIDPNALDDIEAIERRIYDMLIQTEESGRADFARTQAQLVNLRALVAQAKGDPAQEARLLEIFRGLTIQRASRLRDVPRDNMDEFINTTRKAAEKRRKQEAAPSEKGLLGDTKKKRGKRAPTPIIRLLGELGGIDQSNPVAAELKAIGVTPKTHPRLFKKGSKLRFDALLVSEIRSALADRNIEPADDGNGYVDPDWLLEQIRAESFGEGALTPKQQEAAERDRQMDELEAVLDAAGLDIETATNAEIKAAIEGAGGESGTTLYQAAPPVESEAFKAWSLDITPDMRNTSHPAYTFFQGNGVRGQFETFNDGTSVITAFQGQNLSTVLHELGHFYSYLLRDMSTRFPDSAWTKEWEAVSGWWQENAKSILKEARTGRYYRTEKDAASGRYVVRGPYGRTLGSYKTKREAQSEADAQHMNLTVELTGMTEEDVRRVIQEGAKTTAEGVLHIAMEEHFARGFEAYLMEGKAPSMELKRAFRRFKAWLVGIYEDVKNLRVTLSPEIRGVFDRLLATEEQIETMRRLETFQLDPATAAILNSAERERAQRQAQEGVEWAKERLLKDLLREERQKALETYKAERAKLLEENTAMLRDSALYKAQAAMAAGGADAAVVADLNGFTSVDEMQKALASLEPLEAKAERMTDEEMTARHGDMLKDGTIERAAVDRLMEAEAGFDRTQAEYRAASDKAGVTATSKDALKALAQKMHDAATVRDATQATRYMRAAVKAARMYGAAAKAGKWDEAAKWKRQQILNQRLYSLARETQEFIDKSFRKWGRLTKKNAADAARVIDVEYLNAIRAILGRYGIGRGSFDINRWLLNIKDADPDLYDQLSQVVEVHSQQAKPYKSLTVDEFYELAAAVDNLIGVEKRRKEVEVLGKKVLVDEAVDQIAQSIETNFKPLPQTQEGRAKFGFKASREWGRYLGLFKMMETYVQAMDGGQVTGTVHKFLRSEILQAESAFVKRSMESAKEFDEIAEKYYKDESLADRKDAISIPQIGDSYTRLEIITVALNSGNEGNLDRLRDGRGWKDEQIDAVLSYMREKDWQFVQDVWRMINKRWPSIAKDHRERYGYIPAKVQPLSAVRVTADGKTVDVEGGYFPIAYDAELSAAAAQAETQQSLKDFGPVRYAKAQTRQGHKKERASTVKGRPLNLNGLAVISRHLNQVDYDLSMGKAIEDVNKIIRHPRFQQAVTDYMGADVYQDFDLWLKDTAVGPLYSDTSWLGRKARWMRTTYTGTRLALRFATFAVQFTGLTNSIVGVGPKWMGIGLQQFTKLSSMGDPFGAYKAVREKSVFMETNFATLNRDIGDTVAKLEGKSGKVAKSNKAMLFPMMGAQYTVNTITWLGAYNRGLAEGMPEAEAIRYADLQVERTQGSGLVSTLSKIQRGTLGPNIRLSEFVKVWTTLRSYFYTKMNLAMQRTRQTAQNPTPKEVTRLLGDYMLLFWIEAIVADFLLGRLPDDEDDDEAALGMYLLNAGATTAAAGAPGLDLLYGKTQGFESTPASARVIDDTATLLTDIPKIFDGERDPNWYSIARHSVTAGAYGVKGATGLTLPAAQINDYIRGLEKAANGEDASVLDYLRYSDD